MAFTIGFCIRRGSICLVDATYQWVIARQSLRVRAFAVAAAASGVVLLPLAWLLPDIEVLSPNAPVTLTLLAAGVVFGLGARVNGGCAFGTLNRLSGGELNFSGTIIGAICAALAIKDFTGLQPSMDGQTNSILASPLPWGLVALGLFAIFAQPALRRRHLQNLKSIFTRNDALLRPFTAMLVIGVLGGLLFALAGSWTHLAVIGRESAALAENGQSSSSIKAIAGAFALVGGALFAALRSGRFAVQAPCLRQWARCFVGGGMMGASAAIIPGGNGALLIYTMPSGAANGWAAFAMMLLALAISFLPMRRTSRAA
ncbi:YeeE/YedE thiosulfate transporter family protein [Pontixanthobacter sp. CEM42]|uniref:YeeE/YedE thiosulfate transporter family protein n=1 Tax=Pontixanthobacter sp. CEM42 TaxID=2792077 RepID=UPI001ADF489E|nr:YeeE/YedE thiosulfate transporter family protein [Pontixanthobacter sp. CEM42]